MKKRYNGFTMAEMLIVVAIIAVLGGVGFVAVQNHQRSMTLLERDAIAKEIFVAAQNHLAMAESQGFMASTSYGNEGTEDIDKNKGQTFAYYYIVNGGTVENETGNNMISLFDLMLPFGSIDETVRAGGSYIIRYQPKPAHVLDVFYTEPTGKYSYVMGSNKSDYANAIKLRNTDKSKRLKCEDFGNAALGWYGGDPLLEIGTYDIKAPTIEVKNEEKLTVKVTNKNKQKIGDLESSSPDTTISLKFIVKGVFSNAMKAIELKTTDTGINRSTYNSAEDSYTIVLDDITTEKSHFADLVADTIDKSFIPGEDIIVQAVSFSNKKLSNIAYSSEITTNSLFGEISQKTPDGLYADMYKSITGTEYPGTLPETDEKWKTAVIGNVRHLENLDASISKLEMTEIKNAWQVSDLDWNGTEGFVEKIKAATSVSTVNIWKADNTTKSEDNCFLPVKPSYMSSPTTTDSTDMVLTYEGKGIEKNGDDVSTISHSITGITVNIDGNAGLFGAMIEGSKVSNLELVDFNITSTGTGDNGNAGALAGTLENTTVQNVLARHEQGSNGLEYKITSTSGNAGGLVGDMTGGRVEQCAAALYVQGQTAGGLLGSANATTLTATYSGGHTDGTTAHYAETNFNVIATDGSAGGLVGDAKNTTINSCYSTCSAKGKTAAGGLIGSVDNTDTVEYCYATGLVSADTKAHTFLGQGTLKTDNCNYYVSGINGILESGCKATVLPAVLEASDDKNLCKPNKNKPGTEPDSTPKDERAFAVAYDGEIRKQIKAGEPNPRYSYLTIEQICERSKPKDNDGHDIELVTSDFISIHYGDWAEPVALESSLELINAERLTAKVSFDKEKLGEGQMLTMLIKGKTSEQSVYLVFEMAKDATNPILSLLSKIPKSVEGSTTNYNQGTEIADWFKNVGNLLDTSKGSISINLDDITKPNGHFAQLFPTFIPGENIIVAAAGNEVSQAEMEAIFTGKTVTKGNPVYADGTNRVRADITNSLFADPTYEDKEGNTVEGTDIDKYKADIANFRHLENLDKAISGLGGEENIVSVSSAVQINNMDWKEDWNKGWANATVYRLTDTTENSSNKGLFVPVDPGYKLDYDGKRNSITGIKVDCDGNAGLFGALNVGNSSVSNLALIDFDINGGGNAGALAGALTNTKVSNVVAYHSKDFSVTLADGSKVYRNVTSTGGDAGGLVGSMTGGSVDKCAAALYVNGSKNAGGLIGTTSDVEVTGSYSGGHTSNGEYLPSKVTSDKAHINVIGTVNAGGLIGQVNGKTKTVENCYSTCSVSGGTVGGFVGQSSAEIVSCYATGLVEGTTKGAFAGSLTGSYSKNLYYEIINEVAGGDYPYLKAVGNKSNSEVTGVTALDADAVSYDKFVGNPGNWENASAYDKTALDKLFGTDKYSLKTVAQLGATVGDGDFVATHYGDWPAPEALVINTGSAD